MRAKHSSSSLLCPYPSLCLTPIPMTQAAILKFAEDAHREELDGELMEVHGTYAAELARHVRKRLSQGWGDAVPLFRLHYYYVWKQCKDLHRPPCTY